MKLFNKIPVFIICALCLQPATAQYIAREAAAKAEVYHYSSAAALYEKAFRKRGTPANARAVAEAYRQLRNYPAAEEWYGRLVALPEKDMAQAAQDACYYGLALQQNGKYEAAKAQFNRCRSMPGNNVPAALLDNYIASCDSAVAWLQAPRADVVTNAGALNSMYTDWGALQQNGQLYWVSDRPSSRRKHFLKFSNGNPVRTDRYGWTANNYLQLYTSSNGDSASTRLYDHDGINSLYHTGMPTLRKDGLEMFFTRTSYVRKPRKFLEKDSSYSIHIEMYSVTRTNDSNAWGAPVPFRYNHPLDYSVGDPFLTADGKRLYFVSDMPGTTGGTDIYYTERGPGGAWGEAVKLGPDVNTPGQERSPYIDENGHFYFSSDGHVGMGGLDIYMQENAAGRPVNAGPPLNSPADDFYFMSSYFTSNRPGGKGSDDIYQYAKAAPPAPLPTPVPVEKTDTTTTVEETKIPDPLPVEQPIRIIIYYDFDKWNIRQNAARDLDRLAAVLKEKPQVHIRLNAHTDARGPKAYNQQLSQKRAQSALNYLVGKGIDRSRMTAHGYGEEKPVNRCTDGVKCAEDQHQQNRRTEFEVVNK